MKKQTYMSTLTPEDRRGRDRRIPRCSICHYNESAFKYLYDSKNDQGLLNLTGLDHASFKSFHVMAVNKRPTFGGIFFSGVYLPKKSDILPPF
jgi:hypothetical protein